MTKILQFLGGFILSFLLIVGLFTGIIWYTKEYTPPPQPGLNIDSLLAAGVLPDSLSIYNKEHYLLTQEKAKLEKEKGAQALKAEELTKQQAMLQEMQKQLSTASAQEDSIMNIQYGKLATLMEGMKPVVAGNVMNNLPEYAAAKILLKMRKREAGRVMNAMDAAKMANISQLMTLLKD